MEKKYVHLGKHGGRVVDEEWKDAEAVHITGLTSHQLHRGAITVQLAGGQKLRMGIRKKKNGELLLDFVPPEE